MEVYKIAVTFNSAFTPSPEQLRKTEYYCREVLIWRTAYGVFWNAGSRSAVRGVGALPCWILFRTS